MQNRVSLYPGRVILTPVSGQENTYDMVRADEPTQEGTPLNKATLLSDETASALELSQSNPTVNDALYKLFQRSYSKEDCLSSATATLFGLGADAVPDDALKYIPTKFNAGWVALVKYTLAGSYTWTAPDLFNGESYYIGVLIVGAGGSGAASKVANSNSVYSQPSGGASGFSHTYICKVNPGDTFNIVVGAGGISVTNSALNKLTSGNSGGSSSFDGVVADGGYGGQKSSRALGGQCSSEDASITKNLFGGVILSPISTNSGIVCDSNSCFNPFECKKILGAGGSASFFSSAISQKGGKDPVTGLGGGDGTAIQGNAVGRPATAPGCGGGAAVCYGANYKATSGAGADGEVTIYIRRISS